MSYTSPLQKQPAGSAGQHSATGTEIRNILGRIDDALLSSLLHTGASVNEIMQAREWLDADDYMGGDLGRTMPPRAQAVYQILVTDREWDEPD